MVSWRLKSKVWNLNSQPKMTLKPCYILLYTHFCRSSLYNLGEASVCDRDYVYKERLHLHDYHS